MPRAKRRQEPSAGDTSRRRSAHGATTQAKRRGQKWRRSACVVVVGLANDSSPAAASSRHGSFDATCHFTTARRDHPPSPLFPAEARARGWFAVAYFGPLVVVGGFVLPTVLIGIVSIAFDGAKTRCEADLREARLSRERGRSINSTARTSTERLARARESAARERVGTSWSTPFSPQNCPSHQYGRERTGCVLRYLGRRERYSPFATEEYCSQRPSGLSLSLDQRDQVALVIARARVIYASQPAALAARVATARCLFEELDVDGAGSLDIYELRPFMT